MGVAQADTFKESREQGAIVRDRLWRRGWRR